MEQTRSGRAFSPSRPGRRAASAPAVKVIEGPAAAARASALVELLGADPWTAPVRVVAPVQPGDPRFPGWISRPETPGQPLRPGLINSVHPLEPIDPADPVDVVAPAEPGEPEQPGQPGEPVTPDRPGRPVQGGRLEVMDGGYCYPIEDPAHARLAPGGWRLTSGSEESAGGILLDRVVAAEQLLAWARSVQHADLARLAQLPVPPCSSGPLPGGIDITAYDGNSAGDSAERDAGSTATGPATTPADDPRAGWAPPWTPPWVPAWWEPPVIGRQQRRRPHLVITVHAGTLTGSDDLPARLAGYGAITAGAARDLARQAGTADLVILGQPQAPARTATPTIPAATRPAIPAAERATKQTPARLEHAFPRLDHPCPASTRVSPR